jgi:ABC-type dipeptide/oligopeptide/nickel transport system ATPase component
MRADAGPRWWGVGLVALVVGAALVVFSGWAGADAALLRPLSSRLPLASLGTLASPVLSALLGIGGGLLAAWHSPWLDRRLRMLVALGSFGCLAWIAVVSALWFAVQGELLALLDDPAGRAGVSALSTLMLPATFTVFGGAAMIAVQVRTATRDAALEAHVQTAQAWGLPTAGLVIRRVLRTTSPAVLMVMIVEFLLLFVGSATVQAAFTTPPLADSLPLLPADSLPLVLAAALLCILALLVTGVPLARTVLGPPSSPLRSVPAPDRWGTRPGGPLPPVAPTLASTGFRSADFLDIRDLRLGSGSGFPRRLAGINLTVARGEALAVVGDDGDGASLLCQAIAGLLPLGSAVSSGSILLDGTELVGLPERQFSRLRGHRIGFVAPGTHRLNPRVPIGRQLASLTTGPSTASLPRARTDAAALLTGVGVEDADAVLAAYPHQLSDATAQRVLLAAALVREPQLLIADDPGVHLPDCEEAGILDVLHALRHERGFTLIVASTGIENVARCDRVAVMSQGTIVEHASAQDLLTAPQHPHSKHLLAAGRAAPGPSAEPDES